MRSYPEVSTKRCEHIWQNFATLAKLLARFEDLFDIYHHFEPALTKKLNEIFLLCNWQNIEPVMYIVIWPQSFC